MSDRSHTPASTSGSFPEDSSPTEVWDALCSLLDTEDPSEVVSRVLSTQQHVHEDDEHVLLDGTLSPLEETEAVLHRMRDRLRTLRTSNASLIERLDDDVPEAENSRKQLEALIDLVDADSFEATMRHVESLQQQVDALYNEKERLVAAGFASADEALQEIDQLTDTCEELRSQLEAPEQPIVGDADYEAPPPDLYIDRPAEAPSSGHAPPERSESSGRADADPSETLANVPMEALRDALVYANRTLYDHLEEDTNDDVRASLSEIPLDEQAAQLRDYADQLSSLWKSVVEPAHTVVREARDTMGMTSIADFETLAEQAKALTDVTETLYNALAPHIANVQATPNALPSGPVTAQLRASVSHLRSLREAAQAPTAFSPDSTGLDPKIGKIMGVSTVEEAQDMMRIVKRMAQRIEEQKNRPSIHSDKLDALFQQHVLVDAEVLSRLSALLSYDTPYTRPLADYQQAEKAVLHPLNERLRALVHTSAHVLDHSEASFSDTASDVPPTVPDVLDAFQEHTKALAHALSTDDPNVSEKLADAGISSVDDAISMIESMSEQLSVLYDAQESMLSQEQGRNDGQSTFQQLEALYADQNKLQRELGVSDADSIISMVETMNAQLSNLYEERDHDVNHEVDTPEAPADDEAADVQQTLPPEPDQAKDREHQKAHHDDATLEALHTLEEKAEMLAEAVEHLQVRTQQQEEAIAQLEHTYPSQADSDSTPEEAASMPPPTGRLPTSSISTDSGPHSADEAPAPNAEPAHGPDTTAPNETSRFELNAGPPIFDTDELNALRTATPGQWDDHSVGIVQLNDDGTVQYINEAACKLPRLQDENPDALTGQNFFTDLALSTNNDLFRGRFEKGTECDAMQVCFPYTFIAPGYAPAVFNVHMHRHPKGSSNWILLEMP